MYFRISVRALRCICCQGGACNLLIVGFLQQRHFLPPKETIKLLPLGGREIIFSFTSQSIFGPDSSLVFARLFPSLSRYVGAWFIFPFYQFSHPDVAWGGGRAPEGGNSAKNSGLVDYWGKNKSLKATYTRGRHTLNWPPRIWNSVTKNLDYS